MRILALAATLLLAAVALPAQSDITECSTPDPRNAYDYCAGTSTAPGTVLVPALDAGTFGTPFCFPVPLAGTVCPPVLEPSDAPVQLDAVPAHLTRVFASGVVHADYLASFACDLVFDPINDGRTCTAIDLEDPTFYQSYGFALVDFEGDGTYEGVAVALSQTMVGCPLLHTCNSYGTWVFVGVR